MRKLLQKIYAKIFNYLNKGNIYLGVEVQYQNLNEFKINKCLEAVQMGEDSKFYEQAEVHNLQNNKDKIVIGKNTHIRGKLLIFANGGKIEIGNNCYIGEHTYIWSAENIILGNDILISDHVHIIDTNSHEIDYIERAESFKKMIAKGHPRNKGSVLTNPIIIEDNVWISYNVSVLKGVKIGKGAIVAAGSVVTKDVNPFTVVAGNPARMIKVLNHE